MIASPEEDTALDEALREALSRLGLTVRLRRTNELGSAMTSPTSPDLLARVVVDLGKRQDTKILVLAAAEGTRADRVLPRTGTPAVVREEIALVVQAAVEPVLFAEQARARRPPPVASSAPPVAPPAPSPRPPVKDTPSPLALDVTTIGGAGLMASNSGGVARVGGTVALAWARGPRPSLGVSAYYQFPFEAGDDLVAAQVRTTSLRLGPSAELFAVSRFALEGGVSVGFDVLSVTPKSATLPENRLLEPTVRVDSVLTPGVTARLAVATNASLVLSLGVDVDFASRSWVVDPGGGTTRAVFSPWRARPFLLLGFSFTAFGPNRFVAAAPSHEAP